ncbi:hypothetical protein ON010_g18874 [Phytophthora cinnamomi]|nr:hypothetical protein ON010_g18874 [Phytophthora cinnamomi]
MKHGISSPQSVIDEISAAVIVKNTSNDGGGSSNALGVVGIPLSLLETPLATEYALCRWFPLEKAYPGHTARGDLRVSVCYLMRQTNNDKFTMVPYVNTTNSNKLDDKTIAQEANKPSTRRIKKTAGVTMMAQRKVSNNKIFHRKRAIQATDQANKPEKLKPPSTGPSRSTLFPAQATAKAKQTHHAFTAEGRADYRNESELAQITTEEFSQAKALQGGLPQVGLVEGGLENRQQLVHK